MNVTRLGFAHFRNLRDGEIRPCDTINVIYGSNSQGKTNLLEAIAYLGSGKSFRAQKTSEMVRFHTDFGQMEGTFFSQDREQTLRFVLFGSARPRQIFRNGVKKKSAAELSQTPSQTGQ